MRPGFGVRHPQMLALLDAHVPASTKDDVWAGGEVPIRIASHIGSVPELPDEIVVSARCLVIARDRVVVCTNLDGVQHCMPGGRRVPGESYTQTAAREVHEETGWIVDPAGMRPIGWLHFEHLRSWPDDHPWPHPDFLHPVFAARASQRAAEQWTDVEGYEVSSRLLPPAQAREALRDDPIDAVFLEAGLRALGLA